MIAVDTNILVYRWLPSPRSAEADALTRVDPEWAAPLLWRSEFRNVATGYLRAKTVTRADVERATRFAAQCLLGGEHSVSDSAVFHLVEHSQCSSYDCEFVALAQSLNIDLVTEDRALLSRFPSVCRSLASAVR